MGRLMNLRVELHPLSVAIGFIAALCGQGLMGMAIHPQSREPRGSPGEVLVVSRLEIREPGLEGPPMVVISSEGVTIGGGGGISLLSSGTLEKVTTLDCNGMRIEGGGRGLSCTLGDGRLSLASKNPQGWQHTSILRATGLDVESTSFAKGAEYSDGGGLRSIEDIGADKVGKMSTSIQAAGVTTSGVLPNGEVRAAIELLASLDTCRLRMYDPPGNSRVALTVDQLGSASGSSLTLWGERDGEDKSGWVSINSDSKGGGAAIYSRTGAPSIAARVYGDNHQYIHVLGDQLGPDGAGGGVGLYADKDGGSALVLSNEGEPVVTLKVNADGGGEVGAWDRTGRGRTLNP